MSSSDKYKKQIMNDLAGGNVESLDGSSANEDYDNFDDFAQRSSREERHGLFRNAFHHDNIPPQQMEPELQKAIAQIKPNERDDVAKEFFSHLKKRGLSDRDLKKQLGLSTHHASRMKADDVSKLASFTNGEEALSFYGRVAHLSFSSRYLSRSNGRPASFTKIY